MTSRNPEAGFTLVEMLVAMLIFAMLAVAGVGLLRASVDTEAAIDNRLDGIDAQQRVAALFTSDIGQATVRTQAGSGGERLVSFIGTPSSVSLVRGGWANPDKLPRGSLQRVEWTGSQSTVSRIAHPFLDRADPGQPAILEREVETFALRYRRADGSWTESFRSTDREALPAAVELTARPRGGSPLVVVAALPPRGPEPEDRTADGALAPAGDGPVR